MSHSLISSHNRLEIGQDAWDSFVEASDEAWLWHRFDLQDAIATWAGRHDLSFAVKDLGSGQRIVAVVPLQLIERSRLYAFTWNTLESLGGPACANELSLKQKKKILEYVFLQMTTLARRYNAVEINVSLSPMAPAYCGERCPRVNPLLELGCQNTLTQTWVIDLGRGKDSIWANMETRGRNAIRKAEKQGLQIRPAAGAIDLDIYYQLHCETYGRTGVSPHPKSYFESIWQDFLTKGLSRVFFAEWEGTAVAAENFGIFKNVSVYWTGAARRQGLLLQANSLLQWTAIKTMIDQGVRWYETGEAFPNEKTGKLKGLNDFKQSFGGELFPYYRGRIVMSRKWYSLWNFLHTWRTTA